MSPAHSSERRTARPGIQPMLCVSCSPASCHFRSSISSLQFVIQFYPSPFLLSLCVSMSPPFPKSNVFLSLASVPSFFGLDERVWYKQFISAFLLGSCWGVERDVGRALWGRRIPYHITPLHFYVASVRWPFSLPCFSQRESGNLANPPFSHFRYSMSQPFLRIITGGILPAFKFGF